MVSSPRRRARVEDGFPAVTPSARTRPRSLTTTRGHSWKRNASSSPSRSATILLGWALIQGSISRPRSSRPPSPPRARRPRPRRQRSRRPPRHTCAAAHSPPPAAHRAAPAPFASSPSRRRRAKKRFALERPLYTVRLSNRGGDVTSFVLSRFTDGLGKPLDLVSHGAPSPGRTLRLDPIDPFLTRAAAAL
jgi:hypothetical protein